MSDFTIAILKPDLVSQQKVGELIAHFIDGRFIIEELLMTRLSVMTVRSLYSAHEGKSYFDDLVKFMCSERVVVMSLHAAEAIQRWRDLMGTTDPRKAAEHTIRHRYGNKDGIVMRNAVHGSDSPEAASREYEWFLDLT